MMQKADLHIHTSASDGIYTPEEIVIMAKQADLATIAITDHDTMSGVESAIAAADKIGLNIIAGIEFSTEISEKKVHILGYFNDVNSDELNDVLSRRFMERIERGKKMVHKLKKMGYDVSIDELERIAGLEASIGRPHIAQLLVAKGYCQDVKDAFDRLIGTGGPAYVPQRKLTPVEAINLIKKVSGIAVIAHPELIGDDTIVSHLIKSGADGLEAIHPEHNQDEVEKYKFLAEKNKIFSTGGSDFHGFAGRYPEKLGEVFINNETAINMQNLLYSK